MERKNTILVVDDSRLCRKMLIDLLSDDYTITEAEDGTQGLTCVHQSVQNLCLILLDLVLPDINGIEVLRTLKDEGFLLQVPVILITSEESDDFVMDAYSLGASDIIRKPFTPSITKKRIHNVVDLYNHKNHMETLLNKQTREMRRQTARMERQAEKLNLMNNTVIDALSNMIEYRNLESGQHIKRIRVFTEALTEEVARRCPDYLLTAADIQMISSASAMHDIGKIAIPDAILLKPGRLTSEEFEAMKLHTVKGCDLLRSLQGVEDERYLSFCYNICMYHHEKWDGKGYPTGLAGDDIPICAQVVAVADCYDALTNMRVYKPAYSHEKAVEMILAGECGKFSGQMQACLSACAPTLKRLSIQYQDGSTQPLPASAGLSPHLPSPGETSAVAEVKAFIWKHYYHHLTLRDDTFSLSHMDENVTAFGTGIDETCNSLLQMRHLISLEQEHRPAEYVLANIWQEAELLADGLWLVRGELEMTDPSISNAEGDFHGRYTVICKKMLGDFRILHMHTSLANEDQSLGDVLPKRVTREYNHSLRMQLEEKAIDLTAKNRELNLLTDAIPGGVMRCYYDEHFSYEYVSNGFLEMFGYTRTDLYGPHQNHADFFVYPPDLPKLRHDLAEQLAKGDLAELTYRNVCKDGHLIWVLTKVRRVRDDDRALLCCVLIDITDKLRVQEELRLNGERYRIISEQSEEILFDYNIATKVIVHTHAFQKKFGYPNTLKNFPETCIAEGIIHPEDAPGFLNAWNKVLRCSEENATHELRLKKRNGGYIWCRIIIGILRNGEGTPTCLVGNIMDIDSSHRERDALLSRVQRDALTGVYNAGSAREHIEHFLEGAGHNGNHALFMLDIDNFKSINDTLGHLFGDAVLSEVALELQKLFRSSDILGRIGGDEFIILLKDVTGREHILEKANEVLTALRRSFSDKERHCTVTGSVGVVRYPEDGISYLELFRKADNAMYCAKNAGRDHCCVYTDGMSPVPALTTTVSEIDSAIDAPDDSPPKASSAALGKAFDSNVPEYIFHIFYSSTSIYSAVDSVLALIGKYFGVSRAYIFENNPDDTACSNTFEWCDEGVASQKSNLQNLQYSQLGNYLHMYDADGVLYCQDVSLLESDPLRNMLQAQGIVSLLHVAIMNQGKQKGYIGFDSCDEKLYPMQQSIDALRLVANILGTFLLKERSQDRLTQSLGVTQFVMDHLEPWLYIIDTKTYELLFLNHRTLASAPRAKVGALCYEVLLDNDKPCATCPILTLADPDAPHTVRVCNSYLDLQVDATATAMPWMDGRSACLISSVSAPEASGDD